MYLGETTTGQPGGFFDSIRNLFSSIVQRDAAVKAAVAIAPTPQAAKDAASKAMNANPVGFGPLQNNTQPIPEASSRAPASLADTFNNVFKPMAVTAVKATASGENHLPPSAGAPLNVGSAPAIVSMPASGGAVAALASSSSQPQVNFAPTPPPVVIQAPPSMPKWLPPVAIGAALLWFLKRK